ncbi:hypothetical protein PSCICO_48060 [Pseudomonas cichorii]|uniref:hypothetical protein n=1 Tax=Pseudomonas cichorii TaxID=36746 RepID=UPI001910EFC1|nr:hypothetical protein [Pseudomonas cichorii]GFM89407.1 hypothetical protein PSCICO_48060 [Pseudomonas cichorii]
MSEFTGQEAYGELLALPPRVNTPHINFQLNRAKEILEVYESERHVVTRELEGLQCEENGLVALLDYVACSEARSRILGFCAPYGDEYALKGLGLDLNKATLAQYRNYKDLVSNRIDYEKRHLEEVEEVIRLLRKDIDLLSVIAKSYFRGMIPLMTCRDRYWASAHLKWKESLLPFDSNVSPKKT